MTDFHFNAMLPMEEAPCAVEDSGPYTSDFRRTGNPVLLAAGWERRFMADGKRLNEYVELYQSLGYEVHTETVLPDEIGPECNDCRLVVCRQFVTVYTRKRIKQ